MPVDIPTYELIELCELADVTPRTVRYYVQQGLLPSPGTRGPGARYDERHLDRLRLIKRLQREHLPLGEIRQRLAALDDGAVGALVREPRGEPSGGSALAYLRDLLAGTPGGDTSPARVAPPGAAPHPASVPLSASAPTLHPAEPDRTPGAARSTWERIELAPDVELHVRRPQSRAQNKLIDRLVQQARTLFSEEP